SVEAFSLRFMLSALTRLLRKPVITIWFWLSAGVAAVAGVLGWAAAAASAVVVAVPAVASVDLTEGSAGCARAGDTGKDAARIQSALVRFSCARLPRRCPLAQFMSFPLPQTRPSAINAHDTGV